MTTIAYKAGVLAADSRVTVDTEAGGTRVFQCDKLFRKSVTINDETQEVIIATAGESAPGLVFLDWFGSGKERPDNLVLGEADFTCLVLQKDGLYEYDKWCRGEKIKNEFYAVGSGAKAAMGAMHMGASAQKAVEVACLIDPHTAPPVVTMRLTNGKRSKVSEVRKADGPKRARPPTVPEAPVHMPIERGNPSNPLSQHHKPTSDGAANPGRVLDTGGSTSGVREKAPAG